MSGGKRDRDESGGDPRSDNNESKGWRGSEGNTQRDYEDNNGSDEENNIRYGQEKSKNRKRNKKSKKKNKDDSRPPQKRMSKSDLRRAERRKAVFGPDKQTRERSKVWYMRELNPHSRCYPHEIAMSEEPFCRILKPSAPRLKYYARDDKDRSVLHWGQRKLLFSEIEFLTLYGQPGAIVLYAGAAPGTHTEYLSSLFPEVSFVLVDPNDFVARESDKISIRQQLFDDAIAVEFSTKPDVLFVSDIRSANHNTQDKEQFELRLKEDNESQKRWHRLLRPRCSMLKFRLPYDPGQTTYLDGDIYLPVWGPQSTTETRLVCATDAKERVYDHTEYEEQMFHFNAIARMACFPHNVFADGIDHCYDCTSEIYILRQYLLKFPHTWLTPGQIENYGPFDWRHPNFPAAPPSNTSSSTTAPTSPKNSLSTTDSSSKADPSSDSSSSSSSVSSSSSILPTSEPASSSTSSSASSSTISSSSSSMSCPSVLQPSGLSKADEFELLLDRQVGVMSEAISANIAFGRTLACHVTVRHGKGGWGFQDQKISKLLKPIQS